MRKTLKRHGWREAITTDGLRAYNATMKVLGNIQSKLSGDELTIGTKRSVLPLRRREREMLRSRQTRSLQKFASVHANVRNHFNFERHIVDRQTFEELRSAALAEWQFLVS